jgi:dehydrogenase/reductase SDR family protein 4
MLKTTSLLSRRFLISSASSAGQDVRQMATASELACQRRSLQGRVAVVTASTDGSVPFSELISDHLLTDLGFLLK